MRHITQPTIDMCTATCLAMALDLPVGNVITEFHEEYCKRGYEHVLTYPKNKWEVKVPPESLIADLRFI